jgi:deazaflavin-dependent oxidoreductase (nitroreductase family)
MKIHPPKKLFILAYRKFLHRPMKDVILLLTTTGRKTGKPHTIGLQYELIDGRYYLGAADGTRADWYRNILKNPEVSIQVGADHLAARAEVVCDKARVADFLQYRLNKRRLMIGLILRLDGVKGKLNYAALEGYANHVGLVILTPTPAQTPV